MLHILAAVCVIALLHVPLLWRWRAGSKARRTRILAILVPVDAVLATLLVLELGMTLFFAQSDGFNLTFSSRNWFARYWKPINSLGYRDREPRATAPGETFVLVVGDSFVAGHGIDRAGDRFADVLERRLGPGWRVGNAAKIGWDTTDEYRALSQYPVTPDVVVLTYFVNDIYGAAAKRQFSLRFPVHFPHFQPLRYLVDHFALANFVYWRLARMGNMEGAGLHFWDRLRRAYADPGVWAEHASELDAIVAWCRKRHIPLIVLIIPHLADVSGTAPMTARVAAYCRDRGLPTLDLTGRLSGRKPADMMVNSVDSHANAALNAEMAGWLRPLVLEAVQAAHPKASSVAP